MTRAEFIEKHLEALRECQQQGITTNDVRNYEIYQAVKKLRMAGHKMDYCVLTVASRYGCSETTVWRVMQQMVVTLNF